MRKVVLVPTYWSRERAVGCIEGDTVYDHPTPVDEEGTLGRTIESMKILTNKDFKLVILICPTTPLVEEQAKIRVTEIVKKAGLNAETYLFTMSDVQRLKDIYEKNCASPGSLSLLNMSGYANVRNMCLLTADVLAADVAILIDDDEVFEIEDFVERGTEFIGKRIYGAVVHGMAGYYLNKNDQYYDDVKSESWMTYWDRFGTKAQAFDEIIGCSPRIKRTPFAFGGAMVLHKDLFQCVPFDPCITRGEDIDYLINSRMYGFSFFLDNTLSIKHLPEPKKHPQWKRVREDIYRFVYEQAKLTSQYKTSNMHMVSPEDFDPYPGAFLRDNLEEMIFRSNTMLATEYLMEGDAEGAREALNNISIARKEAKPNFDPFSRYRTTQKSWEQLARITSNQRYYLRKVMEEHNLSKEPIIRDTEKERKLRGEEIIKNLKEAFKIELSDGDRRLLEPLFFVKTYFEDETVFRSGDYNDALYIVLKGEILLYDTAGTAPHAEELEIARLKKGDILGESCMSHNTFSLNGRAEQFSEMIGIKAEDIQSVVKINQALGIALYQQILAKVVEKMRSGNSEKAKQKAVEKHFITGDD